VGGKENSADARDVCMGKEKGPGGEEDISTFSEGEEMRWVSMDRGEKKEHDCHNFYICSD